MKKIMFLILVFTVSHSFGQQSMIGQTIQVVNKTDCGMKFHFFSYNTQCEQGPVEQVYLTPHSSTYISSYQGYRFRRVKFAQVYDGVNCQEPQVLYSSADIDDCSNCVPEGYPSSGVIEETCSACDTETWYYRWFPCNGNYGDGGFAVGNNP